MAQKTLGAPLPHPLPIGERERVRGLARVTRIAIRISSSSLVAVYTPFHIVSVNHLDGPLFHTGETVADRTVHTILNVYPVWKNNEFWKFIHPLPWNLLPLFNIFHYFECFRSLTDRISRMTGLTELNIRNPCDTISFDVTVAESTV